MLLFQKFLQYKNKIIKTLGFNTYLSCGSYKFGNFGSPGLMQSLVSLPISPYFWALRSQFPNSMKSDFGAFQNRGQVGIRQWAGRPATAPSASTATRASTRATANAAGTGLILAESHLLSEFIMQYLLIL